jgi:hypothetical protein
MLNLQFENYSDNRLTMNRKYLLLPLFLVVVLLSGLSSCNSKSSAEEEILVSTELEVTKFYLKANSKVMADLDSVFFSLDLDNGLIYNADSLPVGTAVDKLIPMITYPSTVSSATIVMSGGKTREGEVDYKTNPSDSIDFTGRVYLTLVAGDGVSSKTYQLNVNVHKVEPDSLWWGDMAVAKLPSRLSTPKNQKSLSHGGKVWSMIQESDGSYTLSSTASPNDGVWDKRMPEFTFAPDLRSFAATDDAFYILGVDGTLYKSEDGLAWISTGAQWSNIIGGYGDKLEGVRQNGTSMVHTQYPLGDYVENAVAAEFPVKGSSAMGSYSSKWSESVLGLLMGGETMNGKYVGSTWAFDGAQWAAISNTATPGITEGVLIPYYSYLKDDTKWLTNEFSVWLYMGGRLSDGTLNRTVYITFDNGVNWREADEEMALPVYMPSMAQMDYAVVDTPMEANFAPESWSVKSVELPIGMKGVTYNIDGYEITWNCPYIYLFGGCNAGGVLYDTIWRGVINRLSFKPLI